jgi:ribose-phosphate pyrophosphokinase
MNSNSGINPWMPEVLLGFPEGRFHARELAAALGATYADVEIHVFPDGESRVRIADADAIRGKRAAFYRSLDYPNTKIIELVLAASVLGAAAAPILIAPYLSYMRQDKAFSPGEAVSQAAIGGLLAAHFSRFVSFDPHLHRTPDLKTVFAGQPARALSAADSWRPTSVANTRAAPSSSAPTKNPGLWCVRSPSWPVVNGQSRAKRGLATGMWR